AGRARCWRSARGRCSSFRRPRSAAPKAWLRCRSWQKISRRSPRLSVARGRRAWRAPPRSRSSPPAATASTCTSAATTFLELERLRLPRDAIEIGPRVAAERAEVEIGVVLDPPHRDLRRRTIALLRGGVLGPAPEDVVQLLLQQAFDERDVVRGRGPVGRRRAVADALGDLGDRHPARRQIL